MKKEFTLEEAKNIGEQIGINAVAFMYAGSDTKGWSIEMQNNFSKLLHKEIVSEGVYHLHQFSVPDSAGVLSKNDIIYPLRFMSGNPLINKNHLQEMLDYVRLVATDLLSENGRI